MSSPPQKPAAILFDFDGTLVDTMPLHFKAYREAFASVGLTLEESLFMRSIGGKASETIPMLLGGRKIPVSKEELHFRKKKIISRIFAEAEIPILPAARLLPIFSGVVPVGLVSSGSKDGILQILSRLNWLPLFSVIITGEDTQNSKPNPEPYLLAATRIAVQPQDIIVFEDTAAGVIAAKLAGMSVFDVSSRSLLPIDITSSR